MRPTVHAPDAPLHLGVKFNPVRGVHPLLRHTPSGTHPGLAAIFAAKKANIGCGDELPMVIKGIKMVAVGTGYIETRRGPSVGAGLSRIDGHPAAPPVHSAHRSSQIGPV